MCIRDRRITTNPKSINNQKCHKINLHGTLTTKELKKQSTRPTRLVHRDKEIWPNERTEQNPRKRAKRWADSQHIWRRVQSPGNQNAHRTDWAWSQKRGKNEALQSEIKKTIQETNSEGKKTGTQINDLDQKEEINIQPQQNEEKIIQNKWAEA